MLTLAPTPYRPELDGLRTVAVAIVVAFHAHVPGFQGGFVGVDVFLVLSGYLIAGQLAQRPALSDFLMRRLRRLLPVLLLVCAASVPFAWALLLPGALRDFGQSLVAGPLFLSNFLFWHEAGYFAGPSAEKPLLHLWTLGVEGQFYLTMALIVLGLRRGIMPVLWGLLAVSFTLSLWGSWAAPGAAFYLLPFRMWEFLAGALVALSGWRSAAHWPAALGLGLIFAASVQINGAVAFPGWVGLVPVLGTVLVLIGTPPRVLTLWPMVRIGVLSYGIYLWHNPVFVYSALMMPGVSPVWTLPLILALAWASWRWVEVPCRHGLRAPQLGFAVAMLPLVGIALHIGQGAPDRLPPAAQDVLVQAERGPMPCHDAMSLMDLRTGDLCRIGASGVRPHLALIGDSHAGHLTKAMGQALAARDQAAWVVSRGWCLPVPDLAAMAPDRGKDCGAFMAAGWDRLRVEPGIEAIVMAAQWANVTQGARGGLIPARYRWGDVTAKTVQNNAAVLALGMRDLAERLKSHEMRILVIGPLPEYARPLPEATAYALWEGLDPTEVVQPLEYTSRNQVAVDVLQGFAARTKATWIPPRVCPKATACPTLNAQGVPLYRDASHLSEAGAAPLVAQILKAVDDSAPQRGAQHADFPKRIAAQPQGTQ